MGAASREFWHIKPGFVGQQCRDLIPLMESGAIDPPLGSVYSLDDGASAIRAMDERRAVGRLLIGIRGGRSPAPDNVSGERLTLGSTMAFEVLSQRRARTPSGSPWEETSQGVCRSPGAAG